MGFVTQIGQGLGILPKTPMDQQDFASVGQQQGQDNRNAAQFNTDLNRLNQTGPGGSLTYTTGADGQPVQNYTLSAGQQGLYDNAQNLAAGIGGMANTSLGQATNTLGQTINASNLNGSGLSFAGGGGVAAGSTSAGQASPAVQAAIAQSDPAAQATAAQMGPAAQAQVTNALAAQANPAYQTADAVKAQAAQAAAAQATAAQSQAAVAGPATNVGAYAQGSAGTADGSAAIQRTFDASGVRTLPGQIDDTSRRRVEEAIMSRLNPQYENDERMMRTRLLNSGIEVGTDAYNREAQNFSQRLNDARMQAILAGGQEENRQVGLTQGLNAQEYAQALSTGQFGQAADTAMASNRTTASIANANNQTQASMANARNSLEAAMLNARSANDQNLANAGFQQGTNLSNASLSNQTGLANAGMQSQANLANADALTRVSGQNAAQQNQINMANTGAQNTNLLANAGFANQANLTNAGYANANSQFNAGQTNSAAAQNAALQNSTNQYNTGQTNSVNVANTSQQNAGNQFNAGQANDVNVSNAGFQTQAGIANANNATSANIASGAQGLQATALNNQVVGQNLANQLAVRDQQMQELAALQAMSQPTGQQFGSYYAGGNAAPTPTLQAALGANEAWKNQNAQATNNGGLLGGLVNMFQ